MEEYGVEDGNARMQRVLNLPLKPITSCRSGETRLDSLCFNAESMIGEMSCSSPEKDFSQAMNCAYVLEEINAIGLDEARPPTPAEHAEIAHQLALLEKLLTREKEPGQNLELAAAPDGFGEQQ